MPTLCPTAWARPPRAASGCQPGQQPWTPPPRQDDESRGFGPELGAPAQMAGLKDRARRPARHPPPPQLHLHAPFQPGIPGSPDLPPVPRWGQQGVSEREPLSFTGQAHQSPQVALLSQTSSQRQPTRETDRAQALQSLGRMFGRVDTEEGPPASHPHKGPTVARPTPGHMYLPPVGIQPQMLTGFIIIIYSRGSKESILTNQSSGKLKSRPTNGAGKARKRDHPPQPSTLQTQLHCVP